MTKQTRISLILAALALAACTAVAQTDAQKAFTAIKSMPGTWEGKMPDGRFRSSTWTGPTGCCSRITAVSGTSPACKAASQPTAKR